MIGERLDRIATGRLERRVESANNPADGDENDREHDPERWNQEWLSGEKEPEEILAQEGQQESGNPSLMPNGNGRTVHLGLSLSVVPLGYLWAYLYGYLKKRKHTERGLPSH